MNTALSLACSMGACRTAAGRSQRRQFVGGRVDLDEVPDRLGRWRDIGQFGLVWDGGGHCGVLSVVPVVLWLARSSATASAS
jgi:hypothetical protein